MAVVLRATRSARLMAALLLGLLASAAGQKYQTNDILYYGHEFEPGTAWDLLDKLENRTDFLKRRLFNNLNRTTVMLIEQQKLNDEMILLINNTVLATRQWYLNQDFVENHKSTLDAATLCSAAVFLLFCRLGLMTRHSGMVTQKNVKMTCAIEVASLGVALNMWWMMGFGITYGKDSYLDDGTNGVVGTTHFFGNMPLPDGLHAGKLYSEFAQGLGFCVLCCGIPLGALAERVSISCTVIYTMALAALAFPMAAHSTWSQDGWTSSRRDEDLIYNCGAVDYLGSNVVHVTGGIFAAVGALIVGPRRGRWMASLPGLPKRLQAKPPNFPILESFGAILFLVAQVAAAVLSDKDFVPNPQNSMIAGMNMLLGSCSASVTAVTVGYFFTGVLSPELASAGLVAGCSAISAGCQVVSPEGALIIGYGAAWCMFVGAQILLRLRIDDACNAIAVHFLAGAWGILAVGLFASANPPHLADDSDVDCTGMFYSGAVDQLKAQTLALISNLTINTCIAVAVFLCVPKKRYPFQWESAGIDYHHFGGGTNIIPMSVQPDEMRRGVGILTATNFGVDLDGDGLAG